MGFVDCSKELWVVELDTRTGQLSVDVDVEVWIGRGIGGRFIQQDGACQCVRTVR
jgi:hypothetical protein